MNGFEVSFSFRVALMRLFLAALGFEEEDLFPHCHFVSFQHPGIASSIASWSCLCSCDIGRCDARHWPQGRSEGDRTNWVVLEHAQRLVCSWPLHCAVVARHGHRNEAHHNGT
jgi:hypothetical protein